MVNLLCLEVRSVEVRILCRFWYRVRCYLDHLPIMISCWVWVVYTLLFDKDILLNL